MGKLPTKTSGVTVQNKTSTKRAMVAAVFLGALLFLLIRYVPMNAKSFRLLLQVYIRNVGMIGAAGLLLVVLIALNGFQFNLLIRPIGWRWRDDSNS